MYEIVRQEMTRLIRVVASPLGYDPEWANDQMRIFLALLNEPESLFSQSKRQNIVLYDDGIIKVYAAKWEWVLCRKMKRLQMPDQAPRREDWSDCVAITKLLLDRDCPTRGLLSPRLFRQFDHTQREPPVDPQTILALKRNVINIHQRDPLPNIGWVFFTSRREFEYRWGDGTQIEKSDWPRKTGIIPVACLEERQLRKFNFDKNAWVS